MHPDTQNMTDTQLVEFWNDGDGSMSWLFAIEDELERRGYVTRSTDPDDGQERVGGERLKLTARS